MQVKGLVWEQVAGNVWNAEALQGFFQVKEFPKGCAVSWTFGSCVRNISDRGGVTVDEAKGLAQEDFERTIKESLE